MIFAAIAAVAPDVEAELAGLGPDVDIWQELGLDSMDHVAVMEHLVDAVGRDIPERDYPKLLTLAGMRDYLST
jgi:acyl carrier protein